MLASLFLFTSINFQQLCYLKRAWHDGLFKLKQDGVSGNLLGLIKSFLSDRVQRVTLNAKSKLPP